MPAVANRRDVESRVRDRRIELSRDTSRMALSLLLVALTGALATSARADDWPAWRGPDGTGVADDAPLPTRWGPDENVAWKAPLRGLGVSSPIVYGDHVFVTYQLGRGVLASGNHPTLVEGADAGADAEQPLGAARAADAGAEPGGVTFVVAAFDRADGSLRWEHEVASDGSLPPVHQKHNLASSSPVTDGERVYAWFGTGQLVALDLDGRLVWERNLGLEYSPFEIQWGHSSSPAVYEDLLILLCDHQPAAYLLALDARTGEERWKVDRGSGMQSYSTPLVVEGPDGDELIVNSSERLDAYDPQTGEHLWYAGEPNRFPIPVATHEDGVLYTTRGYRSGPYMAIRVGGRGEVDDSHVVWRVPTGAPYISSVIHYRGLLYMANGAGILTVVDAATGERVTQERIGGIYTASPVAGDGKIYFAGETGETVVLEAGRTPRVLARNDLGERTIASPAISDGQIFVRTDEHLIRIGD